MLGFEIKDGKKTVAAKIEKRCITVILEKINNDFFLKFSGSDFNKGQSIIWYESNLGTDAIEITIKDINKDSLPIKERTLSEASLLTDEELGRQNAKNILRFKHLKEELLKRQLIAE